MNNLEFRIFVKGKIYPVDALDFCPTGLVSVHAGNKKFYADPNCHNGISEGKQSGQPFIIMQDINYGDKNKNRIFEKDILKIWRGVDEQDHYMIATMDNVRLGMNDRDSYLRISKVEIIGNVYENPDLLPNCMKEEDY